jgi:hypothetical protein
VEIAGIVIAFKFKDKLLDAVEEGWMDPDPETVKSRKDLEVQFKCCGFEHFSPLEPEGCGLDPSEWLKAPPCKDAIENSIKKNLLSLGIGAIVVAVLEMILLVCALCLACGQSEAGSDISKY